MILKILRNDFIIDIKKITNVFARDKNSRFSQYPSYNITICYEERLVKFPEFLYLYYKNKYLKYKNKYLAYRNLIR